MTSARIPDKDACHRARNLCVFLRIQKGTPGRHCRSLDETKYGVIHLAGIRFSKFIVLSKLCCRKSLVSRRLCNIIIRKYLIRDLEAYQEDQWVSWSDICRR